MGDPITVRDRVLALVLGGRVDPSAVVSHRVPLARTAEPYRAFSRREALKTVLTVSEESAFP